jgi:hypothetical protein
MGIPVFSDAAVTRLQKFTVCFLGNGISHNTKWTTEPLYCISHTDFQARSQNHVDPENIVKTDIWNVWAF